MPRFFCLSVYEKTYLPDCLNLFTSLGDILPRIAIAAGARALRQINAQNVDKDVKTAVLAVYLGMPEEAEQLLTRCKRYDLLNKLYQV